MANYHFTEMDGWYCSVCGQFRPDEAIDVATVPEPTLGSVNGQFLASRNYKYCNDNPKCMEKLANDFSIMFGIE